MITIRELQPGDDFAAVGFIYEISWKHTYKDILPKGYLESLCGEQWAVRLTHTGRHSLVVEVDGKVIGTSSYGASRTPEYFGMGEVYSMYLLPEHMGKGYGKQLMMAVLAGLKAIGYDEIFLWVLEENVGARRFYEKMGFSPSGTVKDETIGGSAVREVLYTVK